LHELSIAQALVEQVEAVRVSEGGGRLLSATVRVGSWRLVVPEILDSYYAILVKDTMLEGSKLEIETVQAKAACNTCKTAYLVEDGFIICPHGGSLGGNLLCGKEWELVGVELED
jgi:hydrogenase nickel incorporation protein HypA/HybF